MSVRYGLVRLKGSPIGLAASRLREFIFDAEAALRLEEETLLARWKEDASGRRGAPRRRKAGARQSG